MEEITKRLKKEAQAKNIVFEILENTIKDLEEYGYLQIEKRRAGQSGQYERGVIDALDHIRNKIVKAIEKENL